MANICVVILNWNGWKDTVSCIKSLQDSININKSQYKILVVDNASTDDSIGKISQKFPEIEIIRNFDNLGFAGGNNVGIKRALELNYKYVCILNNDTVVDKLFLKKSMDFMESNPDVSLFSPKIYFYEGYEFHKKRYKSNELGKVIWYAGGKVDWANVYGKNSYVDEVDNDALNVTSPTDFATGACMVARSSHLEKFGLFDERYFLYLEDLELSQRIIKGGGKVYFFGDSAVWHKVSQSSGIGSGLNDYFITRNRLLFGLSYAPVRAKIALIKESVKLLLFGRKWQKVGIADFYMRKFNKGSFIN